MPLHLACRVVCWVLALLFRSGALAQTFPARPIRLIVPFPAGGTADVIARGIANEASTQLAQPFVLDTRAGANGIIGTDSVANIPLSTQ
jgi:tripartite-type tricarboxylate transporter receptor subunit TctC